MANGFLLFFLLVLFAYWNASLPFKFQGTSDFFGINHYTTVLVSHENSRDPPPKQFIIETYPAITSVSPEWERLNEWLSVVPWGFRKSLKWIKDNYQNPKIYVTENGCMDSGTIEDTGRIAFFQSYLKEMLKAIYLDKCRVEVYTAWTLLDNFEWDKGYTERFGIYYVDFSEPSKTRTPKKSVDHIKKIYKNRFLL